MTTPCRAAKSLQWTDSLTGPHTPRRLPGADIDFKKKCTSCNEAGERCEIRKPGHPWCVRCGQQKRKCSHSVILAQGPGENELSSSSSPELVLPSILNDLGPSTYLDNEDSCEKAGMPLMRLRSNWDEEGIANQYTQEEEIFEELMREYLILDGPNTTETTGVQFSGKTE
ncbi:hypothetical protein B0H16DRAFT_1688444 [Mycena metata]|uniref:Uncharacterized protein n=1 Tax=Mycena metata TaxID=1033252 RepID=A0AAD7NI79_9AGAR|nr:hypothetical protein B0H16DRAFT_1688444 [Mycena metata]